MNTVTLFWVIHFYQPTGNFDHVVDDYIRNICGPFVATIEGLPSLRLTLHFDGSLLERITRCFPDLAMRLRCLCEQGQVELMGGGYFEPIFGMFRDEDGVRQLEKMSSLIYEHYKQRVRGAWLAESHWEPRYPSLLRRAGIRYTVLEDSLFLKAGCRSADLYEVYRTEYLGQELVVVPYLRSWLRLDLRQSLSEAKNLLMQASHRPYPQVMAMVQRGEHYFGGGVPRSIAAGREVLEEWVSFLESEKQWVHTRTVGEYVDEPRRLWTIYLPEGCAHDVQKRTLLTESLVEYERSVAELSRRFDRDRFLNFMHVGTWNGFLRKYPEVNRMHKRLLYLSDELSKEGHIEGRDQLTECILKAQCHTAFWHGDLDGCYANYFRNHVYEQILNVEKALWKERGEVPRLDRIDLDADGIEELRFHGGDVQMIVRPAYGGSVSELSELGLAYNVTNTFRRRKEAYHFSKGGVDVDVVEDWYERHLFQDHFVPLDTSLDDLERCRFIEYGDFIDQPFEIKEIAYGPDHCDVELVREGGIYSFGRCQKLSCQKHYRMDRSGIIRLMYQLENRSPILLDCLWVIEANYSFLDGNDFQRSIHVCGNSHCSGERLDYDGVSDWNMSDKVKGLLWSWRVQTPIRLMQVPIYTTCGAEERIQSYQGSALFMQQRLCLAAGDRKAWWIEFSLAKNVS
ncbi:MAG: DUF1926 domain-containing protein [Methylacidiphilales bacterium]|nr:DUF1926 domain-containing protein [Candidatus Methylacidiphilales bacterium]MDW8350111.1 DUF1926 domain-containing protein [Verrucomicrobiae bacterium]